MFSASDAVRAEWRARVVAEYRSASITTSLLSWLIRSGASPTLLHEAVRIVDDELVHAEMAFEVLRQAGLLPVTLGSVPGLDAEPGLGLLENAVMEGTRVFCLGETVAVRLFKRLRAGATVEVARAALDRVLLDEVRHRDFGWLLLEWAAQQDSWPRLHQLLEARLPDWFAILRQSYGPQPGEAPFQERDRAWGLMPTHEYAEAVRETLERDYVPRFAEYDIDAARAFGA